MRRQRYKKGLLSAWEVQSPAALIRFAGVVAMRYNNYVIFLDQQEHGERFVKVPSACMLSACENVAYESVPLSRVTDYSLTRHFLNLFIIKCINGPADSGALRHLNVPDMTQSIPHSFQFSRTGTLTMLWRWHSAA